MRRARAAGGIALLALACAAPPPSPVQPALVAVEVLRGFGAAPRRSEAPRVVALLDATEAMSRRDATGVAYLDAARVAARRWLRDLPAATEVELRALGGERGAACSSPARQLALPRAAADPSLQDALGRVSGAGDGALAEALFDLAEEQRLASATPLRVVAWSALRDRCDASLCAAAEALARRGVRLDLVVLGGTPVPACLAEIDLPRRTFSPPARPAAVGFRVERLAPEPAVIGCSEAGGLPVAVPLGAARVVVALDPPLSLERSFPPGTRWVLEVIDFPALGPGERQWRWRPLLRAAASAGTP